MNKIFIIAQQLHLLHPLDIHFACMLAPPQQFALRLAFACLSSDNRSGYTCLPLSFLVPEYLFHGLHPELAQQAWIHANKPTLKTWIKLFWSSSAVSDGTKNTPIILHNNRIYLQSTWQKESVIVKFFLKKRMISFNENQIKTALQVLFPKINQIALNWKLIVITIAITRPISIIHGGTTNQKISITIQLFKTLLCLNSNSHMHIAIVACTNKNIIELNDKYKAEMQKHQFDNFQKLHFPDRIIPLHDLLSIQQEHYNIPYHINVLNIDIIIIYESSMITLEMLSDLIQLLPCNTRVIFFNDYYNIHVHNIFNDICRLTTTGYSHTRLAELECLTGYTLTNILLIPHYNKYLTQDINLNGDLITQSNINHMPVMADIQYIVNNNYINNNISKINILSDDILFGNMSKVIKTLKSKHINIYYIQLMTHQDYLDMINICAEGFREYFYLVKAQADPYIIIEAFNRIKIICVLMTGPFGMVMLNKMIEKRLKQLDLINYVTVHHYYDGQPIIIINNASSIGLKDNDIGIIKLNHKNIPYAYFLMPNKQTKIVSVKCLPEHKTSFISIIHQTTMTKHNNVIIILSNQTISHLTRELLYSAVIQTKFTLLLYAMDAVINCAVNNTIYSRNGLTTRLI